MRRYMAGRRYVATACGESLVAAARRAEGDGPGTGGGCGTARGARRRAPRAAVGEATPLRVDREREPLAGGVVAGHVADELVATRLQRRGQHAARAGREVRALGDERPGVEHPAGRL